MNEFTLQARQDTRAIRRILIAKAAKLAREIHGALEGDEPLPAYPAIGLHDLVLLEAQIGSLSRLVREIEDFDAV